MHNVSQFKTKVQRWAESITAAHGESVAAIIAVGEQIQRAKADCSHGEWGELTGETTRKPLLPFSARTARMLKAIADNAALSNRNHGSDLPASWRTLAVLASLDPDDIDAAITDGAINPEMERKDAEALKARLQGQRAKPQAVAPLAEVVPFTPPPMSEAERAAWNDGLKEGGQMIADFAERQAEREHVKATLAQQPAHQDAAAIYRQILSNLAAADHALADAKDLAYFDIAFWDAAMAHATRIVKHLEKLSCK
jgi:hypothetical protein